MSFSPKLTQDQIETVRNLWKTRPDLSTVKIADLLNIPPHRVTSAVSDLGRPIKPRLTSEQEAEAREIWENRCDVTASEIGQKYGVTKSVIIGIANRKSWKPRAQGRKVVGTTQRLNTLNSEFDRKTSQVSVDQAVKEHNDARTATASARAIDPVPRSNRGAVNPAKRPAINYTPSWRSGQA